LKGVVSAVLWIRAGWSLHDSAPSSGEERDGVVVDGVWLRVCGLGIGDSEQELLARAGLTLNPKTQTQNPKPSTLNHQPSTINPKPQTPNPKP